MFCLIIQWKLCFTIYMLVIEDLKWLKFNEFQIYGYTQTHLLPTIIFLIGFQNQRRKICYSLLIHGLYQCGYNLIIDKVHCVCYFKSCFTNTQTPSVNLVYTCTCFVVFRVHVFFVFSIDMQAYLFYVLRYFI